MGLHLRVKQRQRRMVVHRAENFADADRWDLAFWQSRSPEERLSALVAIHADIQAVERGRLKHRRRRAR
jgi:hypothetical protein